MKKIFLGLLLLTLSVTTWAQAWGQRWHVSAGLGWQELKCEDTNAKFKSDIAATFQFGFKQIRFTKEPIGNFMYIGLDAGFEVDFAKYSPCVTDNYQKGQNLATGIGTSDWDIMQGEVGIPIGPYLQFAPLTNKGVRMMAYYHFVPSASGIIYDDDLSVAFNPFNTVGVNIGWKIFSIGFEHRWGSAKYNQVEIGETINGADKVKYSTTNNRLLFRINF